VETRIAARQHLLPHLLDRQLGHQPGTLHTTALAKPQR
jgi:hypothetical protein